MTVANGSVMWIFGALVGTVFGALLGSGLQRDYINDLEQENKHLLGVLKPLNVKCEPGDVWVATKSDTGPWNVRCTNGPRRKK
jgi:ABC-type lipoprotein release transport system permease subunit